jgi:hypothetical protein
MNQSEYGVLHTLFDYLPGFIRITPDPQKLAHEAMTTPSLAVEESSEGK